MGKEGWILCVYGGMNDAIVNYVQSQSTKPNSKGSSSELQTTISKIRLSLLPFLHPQFDPTCNPRVPPSRVRLKLHIRNKQPILQTPLPHLPFHLHLVLTQFPHRQPLGTPVATGIGSRHRRHQDRKPSRGPEAVALVAFVAVGIAPWFESDGVWEGGRGGHAVAREVGCFGVGAGVQGCRERDGEEQGEEC